MKKHAFLSACAGFWYLLQLAAGYYLMISLRDPGTGQSEKLLLLWFGSPVLIVAGLFFFLYFRPGQYAALLGLGKLALGLGTAISLFTLLALVTTNLISIGYPFDSRMEVVLFAFLGITALVNPLFLLLFRQRDPANTEAA